MSSTIAVHAKPSAPKPSGSWFASRLRVSARAREVEVREHDDLPRKISGSNH